MQASLVDPRSGEDFGISLFGIADLVLEETDGPVVVDFKTAARASDGCPLAHELQLTAYAYLLRRATGRKESALEIRQLVKTKRPKVSVQRYAPRSEAHFERFFDLVREFRDGVLRGVFNLRPGWNCRLCGFRPWCLVE
jgi:CRISPR/Cas system-associated exonuclease Cas4 (RecB family)